MKIRLVSPSEGAGSWRPGRHRTDCAGGGGCAGTSLIMLPRCTGRARDTRRLAPPPATPHHLPMTRSPILRLASVAVLCLLPAPRSLLPVVVEYPLPRPKAFPHDPAVGADGIVWYTDQARSEERRVGKECRSRWSPYH